MSSDKPQGQVRHILPHKDKRPPETGPSCPSQPAPCLTVPLHTRQNGPRWTKRWTKTQPKTGQKTALDAAMQPPFCASTQLGILQHAERPWDGNYEIDITIWPRHLSGGSAPNIAAPPTSHPRILTASRLQTGIPFRPLD